jgi:hypothetical protein
MVKEHIQREDEQTVSECEQRSCRNTEGMKTELQNTYSQMVNLQQKQDKIVFATNEMSH